MDFLLALIIFAMAGFFIVEVSGQTSKHIPGHIRFATQLNLPTSCWYWVDSELIHGWSLFTWKSHGKLLGVIILL